MDMTRALSIYEDIQKSRLTSLRDQLVESAICYARIRVDWFRIPNRVGNDAIKGAGWTRSPVRRGRILESPIESPFSFLYRELGLTVRGA